jgi:chemotaxis protein CheD
MSALPVATHRYFDAHLQRPGIKLLPNEFFTTREDLVLMTVLGSCVAACVHDPYAGLGGMNHFMLADDGADTSRSTADSMRYGAYAMEVLINELIKAGGRRERFEAKVFGGAAVLSGMTTLNVGDRNSDFVLRYLALERIRVTAEDLRGNYPRKVMFLPGNGQVWVKKLHLHVPDVEQREAQLVRQTGARVVRSGVAATPAQTPRVEMFAQRPAPPPAAAQTPKPRVELFNAPKAAPVPAQAPKPRVELFNAPKTAAPPPKPRVELFNTPRTAAPASPPKPRIEWFSPRPQAGLNKQEM